MKVLGTQVRYKLLPNIDHGGLEKECVQYDLVLSPLTIKQSKAPGVIWHEV